MFSDFLPCKQYLTISMPPSSLITKNKQSLLFIYELLINGKLKKDEIVL